MNQILTDEDIDSVWIEPGLDECDVRSFARAIESRVAAKLRKQILEEVCYKMASGSPNKARFEDVNDKYAKKCSKCLESEETK